MNTWIGTSGFSTRNGKGNFYPEDLPTAKMLPFYAERFFDHRDQLHFPPDPGAEDNRELENADIGQIPVRAQSAPEDHTLVEAEGLRRHLEYFCKVVIPAWRTTWAGFVSIAADF